MTERDRFEAWWKANMNIVEMDLHYPNDYYLCHETQRCWLAWQACAEQYESSFKAVLEEKAQAKHDEEIANKYYHEAKAKLKVAEDALEYVLDSGLLNGSYTLHDKARWEVTEALNKIRGEK